LQALVLLLKKRPIQSVCPSEEELHGVDEGKGLREGGREVGREGGGGVSRFPSSSWT
jgi:hypothetical protein